jgi:hypothetical protein
MMPRAILPVQALSSTAIISISTLTRMVITSK